MAAYLEVRTRSCYSGLLSCFLGSLAYLFLLLLLSVVDPAAAIAGELFGLYGVTNKIDSPYHSFAYQVEYREGLGENFAASASYLNEGHLPNHHRDGLAPIMLWGRVNVLDRRLSLAVGAGPYLYADTTLINGVAKDDHDVGGLISASATLYTKSRFLLQGRVNWVATGRSMDTFTALVGLGYQLDPPLSPGPLPTPPRQRERTTDNELSVYVGQTVVNNPGSPKSVATCIEYRRGLLRYLDVSAAWLNEGDNDLIRRNGALAQFWLARAFLDEKLSLGGGFGGYFAIDKRKVTNSDQGGTGFASGVISVTASVRDFGFNPDLSLRFIMNRIVTNYDKDTDIFLLGLGYRF
ncbi:MAG: hypothetical protein PHR66_06580 [Desulfuromonadaceae bacterium]|nr:hypothetical protein [Desulfuromonadaceae bacterium]